MHSSSCKKGRRTARTAEAQTRPFEKSAEVSCGPFEIQCSRRQLAASDKSVNQHYKRLHEDAPRKMTAQGCEILADVIRYFCLQNIVECTGMDLKPLVVWSPLGVFFHSRSPRIESAPRNFCPGVDLGHVEFRFGGIKEQCQDWFDNIGYFMVTVI
jgi:hypothetical protein